MNDARLTVVMLYGEDPYAQVFLWQRGIAHTSFKKGDNYQGAKILWVLAPIQPDDLPCLRDFWAAGGHVFGYVAYLQPLVPFKTHSVWIENIRGDASFLFDGINNIL